MPSLEREATRLRSLVDDADAIIVGIGSGMSSSAGFNHYNRAGMARAGMEDWRQAFGFKSLFDGFYHLYPSLEQQWAYYARYIDFMLREPASQSYLDLRSLIDHKDYFILSTNVDTQVEKTFPAERVCNYQGSFAHLQCKQPCCDELFNAGPYVERMLAGMTGFEVRGKDAPPMPALRLAARAVGARRHVSAGRGVARGPRAIRALRARARRRPRAFAGARRGRDDPPASSRSRSGAWPQSCRMRTC